MDCIKLFKELFPEYAKASIQLKPRSPNGVPIYFEHSSKKYWAKVLTSSQIEKDLQGIEQQALESIKSPYVVKLINVRSKLIGADRVDILLFEYIDGEDLGTILKDVKKKGTPFTETEIKKFLIDAVSGISDIWDKGWVHQDIKPRNIRFNKQTGKYVLLDLGMAHYGKDFNYSYGRHPKDYASPEQLKSRVAERVPVTFNSDIFQLGTIAYDLLALHHPFFDQRGKLDTRRLVVGEYKKLKEFNPRLSVRIINIIERMLNPNQGYRYSEPNQLIAELNGSRYVVKSSFAGGIYFNPWAGSQGYQFILSCAKQGKPRGIIISGGSSPSKKFIEDAKTAGYKIIFDPETYLLQDPVKESWRGTLNKYYWGRAPLSPSSFHDFAFVRQFVSRIVQTQLDFNVDYILPPYFNIDNLDSEWLQINLLLYYECLKYCKRLSIDTSFLVGLCVSESLVSVEESIKTVVDYYSQLSDVNAFFVKIDAVDHSNSESLIKSVNNLINGLQSHKPVILTDVDMVVFGYLAKGLSSASTSLVEAKRNFNLKEKYSKKKSGGVFSELFFIPSLLQFVKGEGEVENLTRLLGKNAFCSCYVCKSLGIDIDSVGGKNMEEIWTKVKREDRHKHFVCNLVEWHTAMRKLSVLERAKKLQKRLSFGDSFIKKNLADPLIGQIFGKRNFELWNRVFLSK
jgi:serine/threonine protein kinase